MMRGKRLSPLWSGAQRLVDNQGNRRKGETGYDQARVEAEFLADEPNLTVYGIEHAGRLIGLIQATEEPEPDFRHASIDLFVTLRARVTRQRRCGWRPWPVASGARGRDTVMAGAGNVAEARPGVRMRQTQKAKKPAPQGTGRVGAAPGSRLGRARFGKLLP